MASILPTSTVSSGDWTIVGGAATIHEAVASSTTTTGAQSPLAPVRATLKLGLGSFGTTPVQPIRIRINVEQVEPA